jgi:hypothetical protein
MTTDADVSPEVSAPRVALITGASAGLGSHFARLFAADGHHLVLVARRADRLEAIAAELAEAHGVTAHAVPADLTDPDAPDAIAARVAELGLEIEFLVNNAGFGSTGAFVDSDLDRELQMIAVNITALTHLTRLFLPPMVVRGSGRILNVGSTAGFQAGPFMATYYATKAFVNHFSEALSTEVAGTGVTVTVSCPGATATEFSAVAGNDRSRLFKNGGADSAAVAEHAYAAMMKGKRMAVPGVMNKLLIQSLRVSPRGTVHKIAARLNRPMAEGDGVAN